MPTSLLADLGRNSLNYRRYPLMVCHVDVLSAFGYYHYIQLGFVAKV